MLLLWGPKVVVLLRYVVRFRLSANVSDARASHLLYFSFVYPFEFRLLVRSLVLRTRLIDCLSF